MQLALGARSCAFACVRCGLFGRSSPLAARLTSTVPQRAQPRPHPLHSARRTLHTTASLAKKKKEKSGKPESQAAKEAHGAATESDDPFDFASLDAAIAKVHTKLKEDLSKLKGGGKFNPALVENLRVRFEKGSKETVRLADLAQVVPRGRVLNVIAGEKDHIKAISSAVQSSELSLTPQADAQNPLQLNIQLPPTTAESRQEAVRDATKYGDAANVAIKNARGAQHKKLRTMQVDKSARPDDLKKANTKMEKVVADATSEVKRILDNAKKLLEGS